MDVMITDEETRVVSHEEIGSGYRYLVVEAPQIAGRLEPGQFVHVRVPALGKTALRRPFSVFDAENGLVTILYKTVGRGTEALNLVKPGERLMVEGPLGHGFPLDGEGDRLLIGGGYGVAPLHFLAKRLRAAFNPTVVKLFVGGRTGTDLLALDRFAALGVPVQTATNDGSVGEKGFVTAPLDAEIARLRESGTSFQLFVCGPDGLLKAVTERALSLGVPGWISMDRHMICGVGACYACIQKTTYGNARCCVNGPVFAAEDLVF